MPDDGFRYELIQGELKQMWPAGFNHGAKGMNLAVALGQHVKANNLGIVLLAETGYKIAENPDTVRAPDISFVRRERIPAREVTGYFPGAPDLAVEVISPSDTVYEVSEKVAEWLAAGPGPVETPLQSKIDVSAFRRVLVAGRPVHWMSGRSEAFLSDNQARDTVAIQGISDGRREGRQDRHKPPALP